MTRRWLAAAVIAAALCAQSQITTVSQLVGFIKSSVAARQDDRKLADFVRKIQLTERLDEKTIDDLRAGPKTTAALRELSAASASLPSPAPAAPKAPRPVLQAPSESEQKQILADVTEHALNYTSNLPNFICLQVTRRHTDPSGIGENWVLSDSIKEQLTYFDHHESYKVLMVNDQMAAGRDHMKLGGAVSSGEFGSLMYGIFDPESRAEFKWERWATWGGRRTAVFAYRVPQSSSRYRIEHSSSGRNIIAGYHGLVFANRDTNMIMRITAECDEIPVDFPIQEVKIDLTYDVIKIADQEFVLPVKYEIHSREGKFLTWNEADFRLYRKFGAEASITFDSIDDPPEKPPVKKKP